MDDDAQKMLVSFYNETKGVEYLERATEINPLANGDLEVKLKPVGLSTLPDSPQELKVCVGGVN